ncbi:hypothetical protein PVAP13_9KG470100, partial [Panicum virgatum]
MAPQPGPGHPPPAGEVTVAELEAAVAALAGKRDALREAFDHLAACSPSPLPFAWEDLDAHLSSLQSSISLQFRQVRALEAARPAPVAAAPGKARGDGTGENLEEEEAVEVEEEVVEEEEEVVEVEEVVEEEEEEEKADEEMQEGSEDEADDKIGKDGKGEEAASNEMLQEEEVEEVADNGIGNDVKDGNEAMCEELDAGEEMRVVNEEVQSSDDAEKATQEKEKDANMEEQQSIEDANIASQDKEEDAEDEQDTGMAMEEEVTKKAPVMQGKVEEACGVKQEKEEEQKAREEEEGSKNVTIEETTVVKEVSQDQGNRALPGDFSDPTGARANMDAQRIVKLLFTKIGLNLEFHTALHHAPDAAALALHVVELFLHDKMLKTNKAWVNCVGLIRMVPVVVTELSADTIEQAKPVAKDWKEMIDNSECCTVPAAWPQFETKEIFHLFAAMPRKQQKMNYAMLFKDLRLTDKIPELMDYLIENGQQIDVLYWARVFNLVDKYPPVSLLKGYVEKAKQTAIEISQKNITRESLSAVVKELDNLRRAQVLAEQQITDSSLRTSIREEINGLLQKFRKRKRSLAKSYTASTSNSLQQHTECNKKHKKEQEHHEGQENQQQGQQGKPGEKLEKKRDKPQQKQQQKHEDKLQEKQQQSMQQHAKQPRQCTLKLRARVSPTAQNLPLRGHFGHPPHAAIHGVYH